MTPMLCQLPPPPGAEQSVGSWALYVLVGGLVAAVVALWTLYLRGAKEDRKDRIEREKEALTVAREDAASRTALADALREMTASNREVSDTNRALAAQIRSCPASGNGKTPRLVEAQQ